MKVAIIGDKRRGSEKERTCRLVARAVLSTVFLPPTPEQTLLRHEEDEHGSVDKP